MTLLKHLLRICFNFAIVFSTIAVFFGIGSLLNCLIAFLFSCEFMTLQDSPIWLLYFAIGAGITIAYVDSQ
jgi:hypothetical protein